MNPDGTPKNIRSSDRTHLFLVATLAFGQANCVVKVRNLSPSGALVEGSDLPPAGSRVVLRRGSLEAVGHAVWVSAGRAGLAFAAPVAVTAWLPTKDSARGVLPALPAAPTLAPTAPPPAAFVEEASESGGSILPRVTLTPSEVAVDLVVLRRELIELGDRLAREPGGGGRGDGGGGTVEAGWFALAAQRITRMIEALHEPPH